MAELNINSSVTLTAVQVVSVERSNGNGQRKTIAITNTSTGGETVSIGIDTEAVSGKGFVLYPGGSFSDNAEGGYIPTQKLISAVGSAGTATIAIQERVEV